MKNSNLLDVFERMRDKISTTKNSKRQDSHDHLHSERRWHMKEN